MYLKKNLQYWVEYYICCGDGNKFEWIEHIFMGMGIIIELTYNNVQMHLRVCTLWYVPCEVY